MSNRRRQPSPVPTNAEVLRAEIQRLTTALADTQRVRDQNAHRASALERQVADQATRLANYAASPTAADQILRLQKEVSELKATNRQLHRQDLENREEIRAVRAILTNRSGAAAQARPDCLECAIKADRLEQKANEFDRLANKYQALKDTNKVAKSPERQKYLFEVISNMLGTIEDPNAYIDIIMAGEPVREYEQVSSNHQLNKKLDVFLRDLVVNNGWRVDPNGAPVDMVVVSHRMLRTGLTVNFGQGPKGLQLQSVPLGP